MSPMTRAFFFHRPLKTTWMVSRPLTGAISVFLLLKSIVPLKDELLQLYSCKYRFVAIHFPNQFPWLRAGECRWQRVGRPGEAVAAGGVGVAGRRTGQYPHSTLAEKRLSAKVHGI